MAKTVIASVLASLITAALFWMFYVLRSLPEKFTVPKGAVVAFASDDRCPNTDWEIYQQAQGRFILGIDQSSDKPRSHGHLEDDAVGQHGHTVEYVSGVVGREAGSNGGYDSVVTTVKNTTNTESCNECSGETRPKNVTLLYCRKVR